MNTKRVSVHGNEVTDGRFSWVTYEKDIELLRLGIQAGYKARYSGNEPYGCVLAGPDGELLLEGLNTCLTENDPTCHGEMNLCRQAGKLYDPEFLWQCSIYVPGSPCSMCTCAIFYTNIGRIVHATSIYDKKDYKVLDMPALSLQPLEILRRGNKDIVIDGPFPELADECMKKLENFDSSAIRFYTQSAHHKFIPR